MPRDGLHLGSEHLDGLLELGDLLRIGTAVAAGLVGPCVGLKQPNLVFEILDPLLDLVGIGG